MSEQLLKIALRGHVADFLNIWVNHSNFGFIHAPAPINTSDSLPKWLTLAVNASWAVVPVFAPAALALRVILVHATAGYGLQLLALENENPEESVRAKLKRTMSVNLARIADSFDTEGMVKLAYAELVKERGLTTDGEELKKGLWNLMFNCRYSEGRASIQEQATAAATKICKIAEKLTKRYRAYPMNAAYFQLQKGYAIYGVNVRKEIYARGNMRQQLYDASLKYHMSYGRWLDTQTDFKAAVGSLRAP